jgi:hypothetical protein
MNHDQINYVILIIYMVYLTMVKLTILKMNYGSTTYEKIN